MIATASLLMIIILSFAFWYRLQLRPVGADRALNFEIQAGQSAGEIADRLESLQLIRSRSAFVIFVTSRGIRNKLQAGTYTLSPGQSTTVIAGILSKGAVSTDQLVVPEGFTLAKIIQLAAKKGIDEASMRAAIAMPHSNGFLATKPATIDLEGYLFPDSYQVGRHTTAEQLVNAMLTDFDHRVGSDIRQAFSAQGLSLHQGITLASIVEKEVPSEVDRPIVAGIFMNRLAAKMPLESDVTVEYAATLYGVPFDTKLDSHYNTYKYPGLPVGPVCNPGISAIIAAARPAKTDYLYFLAGKDRKTHYARTFAEHEQNIQKYLR